MAKVSFANLSQTFSLWHEEIDNHITNETTDDFTTVTASGHLVVLSGTGLEYQNGVPRAGNITRLDIGLGGAKATPDIAIENINVDFNVYADVVLSPSPIDRTMALWSATLSGDDQIDFGFATSANSLSIQFAGDGYEAGADAFGGNDVLRGDIGAGAVAGDYITVGANRVAFGGDDAIRLSNSKTAFVSGDILKGALGAVVFAGNDHIRLDREGTAAGDANSVYGALTAGNDTIYGSEDGDLLIGDVANALAGSSIVFGHDVIHGGDGNDNIRGDYSGNDATRFRGGNDRLYGDGGSDNILGQEGHDYLDGGTSDDILSGDAGNDTIRGGKGKDIINGAQGIDTADYGDKATSVHIRLDATGSAAVKVNGVAEDRIDLIENLIGGAAGDAFYGANDYTSNRFDGRAGNDTLDGGGGNDTLIGGSGADKLRGSNGADHFVFNAKLGTSNIDTLVDFEHHNDRVVLDNAIFSALGPTFEKSEFLARSWGHDATTASQHVIYDRSNGTLWYDADGRGGHAAVKFAHLGSATVHPANLNWDDFVIV